MAVFYKLIKTHGALPKNTEYRVVAVENETVGVKHLAQRIQEATSLTPSDVVAAVSALKNEMAAELKMGNNVHLPGLGYFSLAVKGDIYEDPHTHHRRLRNPKVRTVKFRPDTEFLESLDDTQFENMTYRLGTSSVPTTEAVDAALDELFTEKPIITVADLRQSLSLSQSYAYQLTARLEANGKLSSVGTRYRKLYTRGKK
ncbi:HU family DNA-binding protein [Prevotella falsenii]|uniref:HU family DNA-binding protein n=1 Tax=Prevotella falsenii TaxID=515414 RepID=UPI000468E759|nr:HU family DNA-binding protein [Prevotella falsenii]